MEITDKIIVCVNLLDEAKKKGITINLKLLEEFLGVLVVGTIAKKKKTLRLLQETIYNTCEKKIVPKPKVIKYNEDIETAIFNLNKCINNRISKKYKHLARWICLKILDDDEKFLSSIKEHTNINLRTKKISTIKNEICSKFEDKNIKDIIVSSIIFRAEDICNDVCIYENVNYNEKYRKIDKILTSKVWGIPIMLIFLAVIFWLTITGANYPSALLSDFFGCIQENLFILLNNINFPNWLTDMLVNGMFQTLAWVVSVMLPPMAIFFPLFTLFEDLGYLPRIAFNLDNWFKKACTTRKASTNYVYGFWL